MTLQAENGMCRVHERNGEAMGPGMSQDGMASHDVAETLGHMAECQTMG